MILLRLSRYILLAAMCLLGAFYLLLWGLTIYIEEPRDSCYGL